MVVKGSSEKGLFRHLSKHVFRSSQARKYISYEGHLLFENVQNLIQISKIEREIAEIFFIS